METPSSSTDCINDLRYELVYFGNELPQDQLPAHFRLLHAASKDKRHPILAAFFDEATAVLREETRNLPAHLSFLIAPFESVVDLALQTDLRQGPLAGSMEGVLLCLLELAVFIRHHELRRSSDDDLPSPHASLAALGTGLLAAAAVSFTSHLSDLVRLGAEAIRVAFRLGVHVDGISRTLESGGADGSSPESWAYVFPGLSPETVQGELDRMNESMQIPEPSKVFISAVSPGSVTVSGPPSRLKILVRSSELLRYAKWAPLPVFAGLCHAPHVYNRSDAQEVLRQTKLPGIYHRRIPLFSTRTAEPFPAESPADLLEQVAFELITGTINWHTVTAALQNRVALDVVSEIVVQSLGGSSSLKDFVAAVQAQSSGVQLVTQDLLAESLARPCHDRVPRGPRDSKIAIVGMSCRLPGGSTSPEKFWQLLEKGLDVHRPIPADRFDVDTHYDPTGKTLNASKTQFGCFVEDPGLFDAGFFNMSPREAEQTDPMHRLAIVTAHEALEMAGFVPNRTPASNVKRVGVFYGQASDDYREVNSGQQIGTYFIPGGCRAFAPGRINYFYNFGGPSFSCDTACSSSLATVQIACTTLWSGDADMIVAGGLNILTNSDGFAGLCCGHFLSSTGNCKTWDGGADGYCRADGVGSIVLKRLEDAIADNDNILGTILAAATNQSAEAVSITHPHAGAQSDLYSRVMARAGVDPLQVSYVELHGTGTQAGDSTEMESVTSVFAPLGPRRRVEPLHIGAVKSNVGHSESAAGITALIKVLLMLQKKSIPAHCGIKTELNPALRRFLDKKRNIHIPLEQMAWNPVTVDRRLAVVNNFSAAGGNTTVLLEEAPTRISSEDDDPRSKQVVAVSAKSKVSLKGNLEALLAYLEANADVTLRDLAYSTCARRMHFNFRHSFSATSMDEVKKQLQSLIEADAPRPVTSTAPTVAFAFTGQGAFYPAMGAQLFRDVPSVRTYLLQLDSLCQRHGFPSILPALEGEGNKPHVPVVTQLTITCLEIALAKYWASMGITPSVVIGASLGEYAALHVAGVLSVSDTIFLVGKRAQQLAQHCQMGSHVMMAVRASMDEIAACLGNQSYEVACINAPKDVVIDGPLDDITAARKLLEGKGYKCHQLEVPYAFHSSQMDPALEPFEQIAGSVTFHAPQVPVISPLLGDVVFDAKTIHANYMRRATREPVNWVGALQAAQDIGIVDHGTVWVEVGPHPVLVGFIRSCIPDVQCAVGTLRRNEDNWSTLADSLAVLHRQGLVLQWNEFHRPFEASLRLLNLPTYVWHEKNYWIQYRGNWAITKGSEVVSEPIRPSEVSSVMTSSVHRVVHENFTESTGALVARSNVMHPDFFEAANGHRMNDCGVVTSSVHADIAFTIAEYMFKKMAPQKPIPSMNVTNLHVLQGLIAQKLSKAPQLVEFHATTDLSTSSTTIYWYALTHDGAMAEEHFASATVEYGDASIWLSQWQRLSHLVNSRISHLEQMAATGTASYLSHSMAYRLFQNLVDYAEKYRGMQSVILHGYEAVANVTLTTKGSGSWTVAPYFIDSVAHLAGFIMNGGDASNTKDYFYVTPGWGSMRFAKPLVAGAKYRSYVQMTPTGEPGFWNGDVYILQNGEIVGLVEKITFRRFPRSLLATLFSPPDVRQVAAAPAKAPQPQAPSKPAAGVVVSSKAPSKPAPPAVEPRAESKNQSPAPPAPTDDNSTVTSALGLIAKETSLELSQLTDDAPFTTLGVDSLMSLVLSEKFKSELQLEVKSSIFMECATIGELKAWIEQYC